jgi:hypothetical protein
MFQQELKSGQVFGDFSAFSTEYSKAIKIIGHFLIAYCTLDRDLKGLFMRYISKILTEIYRTKLK